MIPKTAWFIFICWVLGVNHVIVTNPSMDSTAVPEEPTELATLESIVENENLTVAEGEQISPGSNCVSPASSQGGVYSVSNKLIDILFSNYRSDYTVRITCLFSDGASGSVWTQCS